MQFTHNGTTKTVRGFFAADGDAAHSSAAAGNIWKVRFAPPQPGVWHYQATLRTGPDVALSDDASFGYAVPLDASTGRFEVAPTRGGGADWRQHGPLRVHNGYAVRGDANTLWIKAGANSPENFLAYAGFDGTTKRRTEQRDGEAAGLGALRDFAAHIKDWRAGDITWGKGRGKGIVGAVNYLADQGMNSIYFLTMNVGGDGNDVWPYVAPDQPDRFDVSKLAQWNLLFTHMQRRGIALHVVLQETENERWLDDGDTGRLRQLYYHELIARFGHHPGLVWNLGEENGPADFSPHGQTNAQRRAMIEFFERHDPYQHPVVLHTHANQADQSHVLEPLLGQRALHGVSLQVNDPLRVNHDVARWRRRSAQTVQPWWVSMDEVGPWQTGATPDALDPTHDDLRRHVLWGALLAGAGGVEWYFGAHQPANDLTANNWRDYHGLWRQTRVAVEFVQSFNLPAFTSCGARSGPGTYCFGDSSDTLLIYRYAPAPHKLDLTDLSGRFDIRWFDPLHGGAPHVGSRDHVDGGAERDLGQAPSAVPQDWVIVVRRQNSP